jgi:hypothetical protein
MFCEDIREEKSGAFSLIGIMPDNAKVPAAPPAGQAMMVPRIAIFVRVNFDPDQKIETVKMELITPDGTSMPLGDIDKKMINAAREDSKKAGAPVAGIILRAQIAPLPLKSLGRLVAQVTIDEQKIVAATLNFTTEDIKSSAEEIAYEGFQRL